MKDNLLFVEIGSRIKKARKAKGLTQMIFSENVGVSTQYISDLERGIVGCSVPTIIRICECLEVPSDYILRGIDPSTNQPVDLTLELKQYTPDQQKKILKAVEYFHDAFSK